ncbi:MAG TPA: hypothetical protein V6C93_01085, partial [Allocoleopsis sp.]
MSVNLQRPILVGGVGLSVSLWLLQSFHDSVGQVGEFGMLGAVALGAGLWLFGKKSSKNLDLSLTAAPVDRETVEKAIAKAETLIKLLETESENHASLPHLRQRLTQLTTELDRQKIQIAVTGGRSVGKTKLVQVLESSWLPQQPQCLSLKETPALFVGADADVAAEAAARDMALSSD